MARTITRCKVCGGTHTPKCRQPSRRADAAIWRTILDKWKREKQGAKG